MSLSFSPGYLVDVIITLVGRELRVRYKGSVLGILWALLSPLGTVIILQVLFTKIVPLGIPHYATFVYSALLPWVWFQNAVLTATNTLNDNRDLVRTPFFPRPLLPGVVTGSNFLLYLLALPVLVALLLIEGIDLSSYFLLLPVIWLVEALFILACSTLIAALAVLIRDVQHLLGVGMMLWFYLTPVFYDLERVSPARVRWFILNPLAVIVETHRAIILYGQSPDWTTLLGWALANFGLLIMSLVVFRALEERFIEEV